MFRSNFSIFVGMVWVLYLMPGCQTNAAEWVAIKTENLSEWSDPGKWWRIENGIFVAESKGGDSLPKFHYLEWKGSTGKDFELSLEYRITARKPQDAGVNFRVERPHSSNQPNIPGYQAELDTAFLYGNQGPIRKGKLFGHIHDGKRNHMFKRNLVSTAGADGRIMTKPLSSKFDPTKVFRIPPEWNHCRVVAVGDSVQLYLNGVLANEIIDQDAEKRSQGEGIALQYRPHGGYRFEVKDLKYRKATSSSISGAPKPAQPPVGGSVKQANVLARSGDYAAAAEMLEEVFSGNPSAMDTMGGLHLATLYAALGEEGKHRLFCEKFLRAFSEDKKAVGMERPAKAYLLFPEADDPDLLRKATSGAQRAVKAGRGGMAIWFELSLGMARYRNGDYSGAIDMMARPLRGANPAQRIPARAFAAMAMYRQNDYAGAKTLLSQGESEFQKYTESKPVWNELLATELAIKEARALIR